MVNLQPNYDSFVSWPVDHHTADQPVLTILNIGRLCFGHAFSVTGINDDCVRIGLFVDDDFSEIAGGSRDDIARYLIRRVLARRSWVTKLKAAMTENARDAELRALLRNTSMEIFRQAILRLAEQHVEIAVLLVVKHLISASAVDWCKCGSKLGVA